jgi:flagellar motor switch protein FliN/FliY
MDLLLDVPVPVVAQLGSTEMRIREILRLTPGSVVALDKLAGEPVDLFVRGQLFAQGEVVIVDESFGIRVTKIVSRNDNEK